MNRLLIGDQPSLTAAIRRPTKRVIDNNADTTLGNTAADGGRKRSE